MSRKRDRTHFSRHAPASNPKRRRPLPPRPPPEEEEKPTARPTPPPAVVVMGLPPDCSVLDLKSRFVIYGSISRIRIDRDAVGYIVYRSKESAEAAIAAALDASFGITIDSKRVQVLWETDPLAQWREGVGAGANKDNVPSSSLASKLLRAEVPLSRHGRGNKLASAIVSPKSNGVGSSMLEVPSRGREIIAYDDIL
ncbi:hypothetical protein SLE2022_335410 [Rubroshorea leprosula]